MRLVRPRRGGVHRGRRPGLFGCDRPAAEATNQVEAAAEAQGAPAATGAPTDVADTGSGVSVGGTGLSGVRMVVPRSELSSQTADAVVANTAGESQLVVQQVGPGGVRASIAIDGPDAPERYAFKFEGASELRITDGGTVQVITEDGTVDSVVEAAWARDAQGRPVPTHYEVQGSTLVQVVNHRGGEFGYGITADPFWLGLAVRACMKLRCWRWMPGWMARQITHGTLRRRSPRS